MSDMRPSRLLHLSPRAGRGRFASGALAKRSKSGEGACPPAQTRGDAPSPGFLRFARNPTSPCTRGEVAQVALPHPQRSAGKCDCPAARGERWSKRRARGHVRRRRSKVSLRGQVAFWAAMLAAFLLVLWLLHEILLPFVAGMAVAYLLDPVATRLQRFGLSRLLAALIIVGLFVVAFVLLIILFIPLLAGQLSAFIENLPGYIGKLQALVADPSRPWLRQALGDTFRDADIGDLVKQGAGWLTTFMRSLWSGGQALISIFSLLIVTPVVAFYLLYDWDRLVETVDSWVPRPYRATVHELAHEIDLAIAGFVRGQTAVCLILGSYYAVGLSIPGLNTALFLPQGCRGNTHGSGA